MVMNLCVLRITFFIFGTVKLIYIYIFIYLSSYINRIVFTIIIFPFGRKISCEYLHSPQRLYPHTQSPTPAEYGTGTKLALAALVFLHIITHVSTDKHKPDPSQVIWGGLSSSLMN